MTTEETSGEISPPVAEKVGDIDISAESAPEVGRLSRVLHSKVARWGGAVAAGVVLAYGAGFVAWEVSKKATPTEVIEATNAGGYTEDGRLRVASFNVKYHPEKYAKQIDALIQEDSLDAVNLQETFLGRVKKLHKRMGGKYWMVFAEADPRTGQGNTIITRAKPESYRSVSLPGSTYNETILNGISQISKKIEKHEVTGDLRKIDENLQEQRSAVAVTIKVLIGDKYVPVTDINSHITGNKYPKQHNEQFNGLLKFVDANTRDGKITIVGADFNSNGNEVANRFVDHRFRTDQNTIPTTLDKNQKSPIDHFAYREKGAENVGNGILRVMPQISSDHKLVEMNFSGYSDSTYAQTAKSRAKSSPTRPNAQSKTKVLTVRRD